MTPLFIYIGATVLLSIVFLIQISGNQYLRGIVKNKGLVVGIILTAPITFPILIIIFLIVGIAKIMKP